MNVELKGNLATLMNYWHKRMGNGGGQGGDYMACVNALTGKPHIDDAHALCAWIHVQATGKTPGHAANEAHHSDTAAFDFNPAEPRLNNGIWTNGAGAPAVAHTRLSGGRHVVTVKRAKGAGYHTHVMRHGKHAAAPKHSRTLHAAKATHAKVVRHHAARKAHGAATPHASRKGAAHPHKGAHVAHPGAKGQHHARPGAKGKAHPHAGHPGSHAPRPHAGHPGNHAPRPHHATHGEFAAYAQEDTMQTVAFDATATLPTLAHDDGYVLRRGKLFEAGDYPDKGYSMTPSEIIDAVEAFTSCPLDLEHVPTVLDGQLGEVYSIETDDDGRTLFGTVAVPTWLDTALGGAVKVSCTWDRDTKQLARLALVKSPRVADAAIMAAFSAAQEQEDEDEDEDEAGFAAARLDTYHGQTALQGVHDMAASAGAVCDPQNTSGNRSPMFAMAHEVKAMQLIHDHAVNHGATCSVIPPRKAAMAAEEFPMQDEKRFMDHVKAFFVGEDAKPVSITAAPTAAPDPKESVEFKAAQEEIARLKAAQIVTDAAAFADGEIAASRALPAERAALIAAFSQAAKDDAALGGAVTFASGDATTEGTRVEALIALVGARSAHTLTQPAATATRVVENVSTTAPFGAEQPMSEDRRRELHMQTPEGRAFLDAQARRARS